MKTNKPHQWIVLLGGMHLFLTKVFLREFDSKNYGLLILDKAEMLGILSRDIFPANTEFVAVDYGREKELLETIDEQRKVKNIIRVISFRELAALPTAKLNLHLGIDWTSPSAVSSLQNKYQYQQILLKNGLPVAEAKRIRSTADLQDALKEQAFSSKSILKPVTGLGSIGVFELPREQEQALNFIENLQEEKDFILEEFLEGEEYSVDGICYENEFVVLANCKKELFENTFVASRQTIGIELNTTVQSILDQYLPILLQKIGISHGFVHLQFWLDGDSITFGEIHNRPGGSYIGPASAIHLGVRPFRALTSYESFKEEIRQIKNKANRACVSIEILKYPRSGVLHSASFPRITSKSDQLILTHFYDNFGKKVTADIKTTFDYAGLIVTKGATIAESAELAIIIKKETRFDIH